MTPQQYEHIQGLEEERARTGLPDREKHMFDYTQILRECENVGAQYVAIFEDDALALDGWFHRMKKGLREVERQAKRKGQNGCKSSLKSGFSALTSNSLLYATVLY